MGGMRIGILIWCYLFVATNVFTIFSNPPGMNADRRYAFTSMVLGDAARPYVYRALMPQLTRWVSALIPNSFFAYYEKYRWQDWMQRELDRTQTPLELRKEWILYSWLAILCFAGLGWSLHSLLDYFYPENASWSHLWGLLGLSFLPLLFDFHGQMYDPASAVIFPLAFLAMVKRWRGLYYLWFLLATLNKETAFLLVGFYVIDSWGERRWLDWLTQGGVYIFITVGLRWLYRYNPGDHVENQLSNNLHVLSSVSLVLLSTWIKLFLMIGSIWVGRRQRAALLRHCLLWSMGVLIPLWLVYGRFAEIRGFLECYFLLFLLAYPNLCDLFSSHSDGTFRRVLRPE